MNKSPHGGHRARLRETYMESGAGAMHDHQLLELLLTYAIPRKDVNPLAHALISHYGTLDKVLRAEPHELAKFEGVGENTAVLLSLAGGLMQRQRSGGAARRLNTPDDAMEYCMALLGGERYESMYVISLDKNRTVLHSDKISGGTLTETVVYPRLVVECALRHMAHSVILTHNHPSGNAEPSREDVKTTELILGALTPIGIAVYDHIVVGGDSAYSMVRDEVLSSRPDACSARAAERKG